MNKYDPTDLKPCTHMQTLVSRKVDGELSGLPLAYTNWHIGQCPRCRAGVQNLIELKRRLGALDSDRRAAGSLPPDSWEKVESALDVIDDGGGNRPS